MKTSSSNPMLELSGLGAAFGGSKALNVLGSEVVSEPVTSVNDLKGARKTSLFKYVSGFYRTKSDSIGFDGEDGFQLRQRAHLPSADALACSKHLTSALLGRSLQGQRLAEWQGDFEADLPEDFCGHDGIFMDKCMFELRAP